MSGPDDHALAAWPATAAGQRVGVVGSMSRTGVCWDKRRCRVVLRQPEERDVPPLSFTTRARARFAVAEYIEVFYKRQRLHGSLGSALVYNRPDPLLSDLLVCRPELAAAILDHVRDAE